MNGYPWRGLDRGGFVLAVVVMMLFAISVAGAAGYLVVNAEFDMARHSDEGAEALSVARAGLHRFVAEQIGVVGDSVSYAVGSGVAMITTRKLAVEDPQTDLYYLRSEATVTNIFTPASPARRVVGAYAYHHRRPLRHFAAMIVTSASAGAGNVGVDGVVSGNNHNVSGDCPGGGAPNIIGAVARTSTVSLGTLQGNPAGRTWGSYGAIYDSVGLRWDVIASDAFPVDYDNVQPNWGALPADSFPVVRWSGTFTGSGWNGRGVLIVKNEFDPTSTFFWNGIVLAGEVDDINEGHIRGMLVGGLNGQNPKSPVVFEDGGYVRYYYCYAYEANESLSYLELIEDTEFEVN